MAGTPCLLWDWGRDIEVSGRRSTLKVPKPCSITPLPGSTRTRACGVRKLDRAPKRRDLQRDRIYVPHSVWKAGAHAWCGDIWRAMSRENVEAVRRAPGSAAGSTLAPLTEIRLGGACLSVDLQQVGGDQLPVGRLLLVGEILPTGYRTTTCI